MIKAVFALGVPVDFHKHGIMAFGRDNELPWPAIPEDFNLFREKTMGTVCVMGAKTFQSLPKNLPGRVMVVIGDIKRECRNKSGQLPELMVNDRIDWVSEIKSVYPDKDISVIGGLNLIMNHLKIFDEVHINFPMLTMEYDMISPTIYIGDADLMGYLDSAGFKLQMGGRVETTSYFCQSLKTGVWRK